MKHHINHHIYLSLGNNHQNWHINYPIYLISHISTVKLSYQLSNLLQPRQKPSKSPCYTHYVCIYYRYYTMLSTNIVSTIQNMIVSKVISSCLYHINVLYTSLEEKKMQILYNRNVLYYVTKHSKHDRIQGYIIMHPQCQRIASIMLTY